MSWDDNFSIRTLSPDSVVERNRVEEFLRSAGLEYEDDIDYTVGIYHGTELAAVGSLAGRVIKGVAVGPSWRGSNLTGKLLSYLKLYAYHQGIHSLFLYTSPANRELFTSVGYSPVAATDDVLLMEDTPRNFRNYLHTIKELNPDRVPAASLVMNCNPFTLGHRYLVEQAAEENPLVFLFAVQEDRSVFPFDVRIRLIREGTADLANVHVIPGGDYIISAATFPSYFIKDKGKIFDAHTRLDLTIFGESIAPAGGIVKRYVGHEPFCAVTESYNRTMKELLPTFGTEVVEISRREESGRPISASEVRRLIHAGRIEDTARIVPPSTYAFLLSNEAEPIRKLLEGASL